MIFSIIKININTMNILQYNYFRTIILTILLLFICNITKKISIPIIPTVKYLNIW